MIRRRGVYHIAGYYPIGGTAWHRYFKRELALFARTWNVRSEVSDLPSPVQDLNPTWTVKTTADNWRVETTYEPLLWDDIVLADLARPTGARFGGALRAVADFFWSGALFRYFWANWQYAIFVLFPFILLVVFAAIACAAAMLASGYLELSGLMRGVFEIVLGIGVFTGLIVSLGRRWRLQHALDDWSFSWGYLHRLRPDIDARIDRFADELVAQARRNALDEIVIVGHSLGATLAIDMIARALARDPDLGRHGPSICLVTVGSTIPKFTLHPAGAHIRAGAARIVSEPTIDWAEFHARADAISFYKINPVTQARFYGDRVETKPVFRRVRLHHMLTPQTYRRHRLNFMRLHCQFIMANELRSIYDYFMMICGPIPFAQSVRAPKGFAELIAGDGAVIDTPVPAYEPKLGSRVQ